MFRKIFGKEGAAAPPPSGEGMDPQAAPLPLAIPPLGKEVVNHLLQAFHSERGVQIEAMLTVIGSLAGFACQMSIRESLELAGDRRNPFVVIGTKDGRTLYFGDALNRPLAESQYSVWSFAAGALQQLQKPLPDMHEIFRHVTSSAGTPAFEIIRYAEGAGVRTKPSEWVKAFWPSFLPFLREHCRAGPLWWPVVYGCALHEIIVMARDAIDPSSAARIAMEAAVAMSKIDPREVGCEYRELEGYAAH